MFLRLLLKDILIRDQIEEKILDLQKIVTVNGRSYSDPIFNSDGTVNLDASRRVEFKFRLKDEEMIGEMIKILSDGESEN